MKPVPPHRRSRLLMVHLTHSGPLLGLIVALAGVAASLAVGAALRQAQASAVTNDLDRRVELVSGAVDAETGRYVDTLRTVATAAGTFDRLTATSFARLTEPLKTMRLAGVTSIAYLVPVADAQVAGAQATWRRHGSRGLRLRPAGRRDEHIFSVLVERLDGGPPIPPGTDATQAAAPAEALNEARRSGTVAVSDTYKLLADRRLPEHRRQLSFILAAPVLAAPDASGRRAFRGWVLMGLRGQDFIGTTLRSVTQDMADVALEAHHADGSIATVARLTGRVRGERDLRRTVDVEVAQRRWRLSIGAVGSAMPADGPLPAAMTLAGLGLTGLLVALIVVLASGRSRARSRVRAATAELLDAESQARRQADLLAAILDSIGDGVGVVDEAGRFLLHNPAAKRMLGVEEDRSGVEHWQAHYGLFQADGRTPFPEAEMPLARALAGESTDGVEMLVRNPAHPEGVTISVAGRPLHSLAGRRGAVAVFRDITHAKRAEAAIAAAHEQIAEQKAYLDQMLDALEVSVTTCDLHGRIVRANRVARQAVPEGTERVAVAEAARAIGLRHPDGTPIAADDLPLMRALRGEEVRGEDAVVDGADGARRFILMHATPLRDRDGALAGAMATSYPITALREREAELRAFTGAVAHDLRSPLTTVQGFAEIARDELLDGTDRPAAAADAIGALDRVLATTDRMRRLIDDLLTYAAARDGQLAAVDVDLGATVRDMVAQRIGALDADPLATRPDIHVGDLPAVHADPGLVRQLIDNLLGNALKFTAPTGTCRIDVTGRDAGDGRVQVHVADRGIGIPPGQHEAIFDGFHRAHAGGGYAGTGLGLAICQRIVARHGGTIEAADNPGGGARLSFTLPAAAAPALEPVVGTLQAAAAPDRDDRYDRSDRTRDSSPQRP